MGNYFIDQYILLHFSVGVVAYFWGVNFWTANLLHLVFELAENTQMGMWVINNLFTAWPGGKPRPDAYVNMLSDTIAFGVGWLFSQWLDGIMGDPY